MPKHSRLFAVVLTGFSACGVLMTMNSGRPGSADMRLPTPVSASPVLDKVTDLEEWNYTAKGGGGGKGSGTGGGGGAGGGGNKPKSPR